MAQLISGIILRMQGKRNKKFFKSQWRCVGLPFAKGWFIVEFAPTTTPANLMRSSWPVPVKFWRWGLSIIIKPSRLVSPVAIGTLPNLASPTTNIAPNPLIRLWFVNAISLPGFCFGWML